MATSTLLWPSAIDIPNNSVKNPQSAPPAPASSEALRLLKLNHDTWDIFFKDVVGHNHTAHSILSTLALGAEPSEIQRAYDDTENIQRLLPEVDQHVLEALQGGEDLGSFLGQTRLYATFLTFFDNEVQKHGWQSVVQTYVFAQTSIAEKMLVKMFEGMYHPIIHLGLGIEFELPGIITEALAQAAVHEDGHIANLFLESERIVASQQPEQKPLITLVDAVRADEKLSQIAKFAMGPMGWNSMRDDVMGEACSQLAQIAAHFQVTEQTLERRTAEMMSVAAYMAGASQRDGRKRKIDFVLMHAVTSSMFFPVILQQDWIGLQDKVRIVEWKGRLDLAMYAYCHCPELHCEAITEYRDDYTREMTWSEVCAAVSKEHDDGHLAKFVRALRSGEDMERPEYDELPVRGNMWLKIARMALGTTRQVPQPNKWIMRTGFDQAWAVRQDLEVKVTTYPMHETF